MQPIEQQRLKSMREITQLALGFLYPYFQVPPVVYISNIHYSAHSKFHTQRFYFIYIWWNNYCYVTHIHSQFPSAFPLHLPQVQNLSQIIK